MQKVSTLEKGGGGHDKFYPVLMGGGGVNSFGSSNFPFCSPLPIINDQSLSMIEFIDQLEPFTHRAGVQHLPVVFVPPIHLTESRLLLRLTTTERQPELESYYPPEVSSMKYCCLGVFRKECFRLITKWCK